MPANKDSFLWRPSLIDHRSAFDFHFCTPRKNQHLHQQEICPCIRGKRRGFYLQEHRECTTEVPRSPLGASDKGQKEHLLCQKMAFNRSVDEQDLLRETEEESWRLLMAPHDRFIDKENASKYNKGECLCILYENLTGTIWKYHPLKLRSPRHQ